MPGFTFFAERWHIVLDKIRELLKSGGKRLESLDDITRD
jgi:hypothetical protein